MAVAALVLVACAPKVGPLVGSPSAARLPETHLAPGHQRLVFRWQFDDHFFSARGEGVARIAPPDSVRLDFFGDGGLGSGFAVLLGNEIFTPANDDARRYLPPVGLLWASLGVLRVSGADTTARVMADTLRADIGHSAVWRVAFAGQSLVSLQRIDGNRLREQVRRDSVEIMYRNFGARRRLTLTHLQHLQDGPFDEAIWRH